MAALTPILETMALRRVFGGLVAVQSVDFHLNPGEIRGIIGPNGAGKTTLVSMICGRVRPTSGRIVFQQRDITKLRADERVRLGIVYTFQLVSVFKSLTARENVIVAAQRRLLAGPESYLRLDRSAVARHAQAALAEVGLHNADARPAGVLPYGHQRLLEIAMALALRPRVLALDEPTQGLAPHEVEALAALIRDMAGRVAVLLIEHNMSFVLDVSHSVTVMDRGGIIAQGTPQEVERDPLVQRVYLGLPC